MSECDQSSTGVANGRTLSSSNFFDIPGTDSTVAYEGGGTSPLCPPQSSRRGGRLSCSSTTADAGTIPSPDASIDCRLKAEKLQPAFFLSRRLTDVLLSHNRHTGTSHLVNGSNNSGSSGTQFEYGISTSNAFDQSRNVGDSKVFALASKSPAREAEVVGSRVWAMVTSTVGLSRVNDAPTTSPANWQSALPPLRVDGSVGAFPDLLVQESWPSRGTSSATTAATNVDDKEWAVLHGPAPVSRLLPSESSHAPRTAATPVNVGVGGCSAAECTLSFTPSSNKKTASSRPTFHQYQQRLPYVLCSPMVEAVSPSPVMSLARPMTVSPGASVSNALYDVVGRDAANGGNASNTNNTSSAGDNRFSMVLGVESPRSSQTSTKPPVQSNSYLRFMPLDEQSFLPDEMWECSVSDPNRLRNASNNANTTDTNADARRRCSSSLYHTLHEYSSNQFRSHAPSAATACRTDGGADVECSTLVDDLLVNRYFDGMLSVVLQYGDAMMRTKQRRGARRGGQRRVRGMKASTEASGPLFHPGRQANTPQFVSEFSSSDVSGRPSGAPSCANDDFRDNSYGPDGYGMLNGFDEYPGMAAAGAGTVSALFMQVAESVDEAQALVVAPNTDKVPDAPTRRSVRSNTLRHNSNNNYREGGGDANALRVDSSRFGERSVSSAMREVEELMEALDIMPALSWKATSGATYAQKAAVELCNKPPRRADEDGEERKGVNRDHFPAFPPAPALSESQADFVDADSCNHVEAEGQRQQMERDRADKKQSDTPEYVALPTLSDSVCFSAHRQGAAAPLLTWSWPDKLKRKSARIGAAGAESPVPITSSKSKKTRLTSQPPLCQTVIAGEGKDTLAPPVVQAEKTTIGGVAGAVAPTSSPSQKSLKCTNRYSGATVSSRTATADSESQLQQEHQLHQSTIAAILRARTMPSDRSAPLALLIEDGESVRDASLSTQHSAGGQNGLFRFNGSNGQPVTLMTSTVSRAEKPLLALQDTAPRSDGIAEEEWRASEKVTFFEALGTTASHTVPNLAKLVASGFNVSLVSLHARRSKPANFTSWGSLFPEFFTVFFARLQEMNKAPSSYCAMLSVSLLKCDLYRDLLSDVVCFTPVAVLGTPLLGARLQGLTAVSVYDADKCLRTLIKAHERLSFDDYANGSIVVMLYLKQETCDEVTGERRDVLLSSLTTFATNVEVYADVLQVDRLPATTELLLQLFRGPVQTAIAVSLRHLKCNAAEVERALEVQRVLCSRATLPPRLGSVVGLLSHIHSELRAFWDVLHASKARAAERRRALMNNAVVVSLIDDAQAQVSADEVAWEDDAYRRERAQRAQLRYVLRALTCLGSDCKDALCEPVTKLPPVYLLSHRSGSRKTWHLRQHDNLCPHYNSNRSGAATSRAGHGGTNTTAEAEPKRAGGEVCDVASDDSGRAIIERSGGKRDSTKYGRPVGMRGRGRGVSTSDVVRAALNWSCDVPPANLFAGDAACGWRGIRPFFRSCDAQLRAAFLAADGSPLQAMVLMEKVVYLEVPERDRACSSPAAGEDEDTLRCGAALPSGKAKSGIIGFTVNDFPVGAPRVLRGMPRFHVDELCVRYLHGSSTRTPPLGTVRASNITKGGSSSLLPPLLSGEGDASGFASSNSSVSSIVRAAFRGFLDGQNVSIFSVTEASAETDAVTRMMRSPLWLATRELVEAVLHGTDSNNSTSSVDRQVLYMSITQPISIDCIKDHLSSGNGNCSDDAFSSAAGGGKSHHGVSTNSLLSSPNADEVMAFQAAWTPAGPVVAGARYIPITSVSQFYKVTRELPSHVRAVADSRRTESRGGTHVLVSFLLRRCGAASKSASLQSASAAPAVAAAGVASATAVGRGNASVFSTAPQPPVQQNLRTPSPRGQPRVATMIDSTPTASPAPAAPTFEHVFFTSATVLLSTEAMFWNTLQLGDHVPPSHPLNLLRPVYGHRVVNVVDVAASAVERAWPLLLAQERMTQRTPFLLWRVPWSMSAYTAYLAKQRDALRWCMTNLVSSSSTTSTATTAKSTRTANTAYIPIECTTRGRLQIDLGQAGLPDWVRDLFYGKRVWLSDLTAILRQVELMYAIGVDLLESRYQPQNSWTESRAVCDRPTALFDGKVAYDITVPPKVYVRTPLDPVSSPPQLNGSKMTTLPEEAAPLQTASAAAALPVERRPPTIYAGRAAEDHRAEHQWAPVSPRGARLSPSPRRVMRTEHGNAVEAGEGEDLFRQFVQKREMSHTQRRPEQQAPAVPPAGAELYGAPPSRAPLSPQRQDHTGEPHRIRNARYSPLKLLTGEDKDLITVAMRQRETAAGTSRFSAPFLQSMVVDPAMLQSNGCADTIAVAAAPRKLGRAACEIQPSGLPDALGSPRGPRTLPTTTPAPPIVPGANTFTHSTSCARGPLSPFGNLAGPSSVRTTSHDPQCTTPSLTLSGRRPPSRPETGDFLFSPAGGSACPSLKRAAATAAARETSSEAIPLPAVPLRR